VHRLSAYNRIGRFDNWHRNWSADQLGWFWISWHNGNVSYGRGNQRYRNVIGHYNDSGHDPFSVDTMLISSYGDTSWFWVIPSVYYITGSLRVQNFHSGFVIGIGG